MAETSLTIEGVRIVIDSGLAKIGALRSVSRHPTPCSSSASPAPVPTSARPRGTHGAGSLPALVTEREHHDRAAQGTPRGENGSTSRKWC
ncbi:MAG: hypothetical protein WDN28_28760 [Chthoniobacter sp.]